MSKPLRIVLVVEDTGERSNEYKQQLKEDASFSYQVFTEQYTSQTIARCCSQQIDGILLDFHSPDADCLKFLSQLKEHLGENYPPVVVVDNDDAEIAVLALKNGATDYLVKNRMTPDDLRGAMRGAIENGELKRELQRSQAKFQTSVENMMDCFGIFSAMRDESGQIVDFRIDYLNEAACKNNRMTKERLLGRGLCEVFPNHRSSGLFDEYCQLVETGEPLIKESLVYEDTFGEQRLVRAFDIRATKLNDGFVASWRDVTSRKCLELELNKTLSETQLKTKRLQKLIDNAPIGIGIGSANGEVKLINDAMLGLHGLTREEFELEGMNWREFIPPEMVDQTEQEIAQFREQGFVPPGEKVVLRRDGTRVPVWISGIGWTEGTDTHVSFVVDLTRQKQTEAALQDNQQRYQTLAEAMPQMVWTADATGAINYWNSRWYEYTGLSETESMGLAGVSIIHPENRDRVVETWSQSVANGEPFELEYQIRRWDGNYNWFICRAIPTRNNQGQITGWIGTITDIDQIKQSEVALQRSEQQVRRVLDSLFSFVGVMTPDGVLIEANQTALLAASLSPADVLGKPFPETYWWSYSPEIQNKLQEAIKQAAKGEVVRYDVQVRLGEDKFIIIDFALVPMLDQAGAVEYLIPSGIDISDRVQTEISLRESQAQLQQQLAEIEAIYQTAPIGLSILDRDLRFVRINEQLAQINGLSIEAHLGRTVWEVLPNFKEMTEQLLLPILETGEPLLNVEIQGETPAQPGVQRTWLEHFVPLKKGEEVIGISIVCEEITERKRFIAALLESEEKFRQIAENLVDTVFWICDIKEEQTIYVSPAYERIWGSPSSNLYANFYEWMEKIYPEDRERVEAALKQILSGGYDAEYRIVRPDGTIRWIRDRAFPIKSTSEDFSRVVGVAEDITEKKQAEAALQASEERFRTLADNISQFVWMADATGWLFWYNQRWFEYTGTTLEQMQGWGWRAVHHPDHVERVVKKFSHCLKTGEAWEDTFQIRSKNGEYRWFLSRAVPIRDETGNILRWFGTNTDITQRKQTEEALRESEDRLRMAISSAELGTWDWNLVTNQLTWDIGCKAMFGLPSEAEITIETFYAVLHPGDRDRLEQAIQAALNPEGNGNYNTEYRTIGIQDGIERWIAAKGQVYFDNNGKPLRFVGTVLNITEQKQTQALREQLLQREQTAREEAERANRLKDEFLAILSHELRSPLNPILGWIQLLQTGKLDSTRTTTAIATIERNAKLQSKLIDDLLDIARILRGKLVINAKPTDLVYVVENALETVRTTAEAKCISLDADLAQIGQVSGDLARLQQIFWNLLSNAVKFTPSGGRVEVRLKPVENWAQITVTDTGKGISADFLPQIFECFRQEDASITRQFGGLGLGLAIVRELVEAHGGTITADSQGEGKGSTFIVTLPLLNFEPGNRQRNKIAESDINLSGVRVLVVDDDADARAVLAESLTQYGAQVRVATSANEALSILSFFQPNVLVSDIGMPNVDGYTLMQQIRALPPEKGGGVKAIALTAYAREEDSQRALESGYQAHIAKPLELEQLLQIVAKLANAQ